PRLIGSLTHFARACQTRHKYRTARRHYQEALGLITEAGGDRHPRAAAPLADLACPEGARGKPQHATPPYEHAAGVFPAAAGGDGGRPPPAPGRDPPHSGAALADARPARAG